MEHRPTLTFACTSLTWSLIFNRDSRTFQLQFSENDTGKVLAHRWTCRAPPSLIQSCLRRFSPLWAPKPPSLSGCSCSLLTSSSLTPPLRVFFLYVCVINAKIQHPAESQRWPWPLRWTSWLTQTSGWHLMVFEMRKSDYNRVRVRALIFLMLLGGGANLADRWMGRLSIRWRGSQRSPSGRQTCRGE